MKTKYSRGGLVSVDGLEARRVLASLWHGVAGPLEASYSPGAESAVGGNAAGRSVVVGSSNYDIVARGFNADSSTSVPAATINQQTAGNQATPDVSVFEDGSFVVVWVDQSGRDGSDFGIYGRLFSATGTPLTDDLLINATTAGRQDRPRVSANRGGEFIVTWESDHPGRGFRNYNVMARRFVDGNGGTELTITDTQSWEPAVALQYDGTAVVAYERANGTIFVHRVLSETVGEAIDLGSDGRSPDVAIGPDQAIHVAFESSSEIKYKKLTADGTSASDIRDVTTSGGSIADPANPFGRPLGRLANSQPSIVVDVNNTVAITSLHEATYLNSPQLSYTRMRISLVNPRQRIVVMEADVVSEDSILSRGVVSIGAGQFAVQTNLRRAAYRAWVDLSDLASGADDALFIADNPDGTITITRAIGSPVVLDLLGDFVELNLGAGNNIFSEQTAGVQYAITAGSGNDTIFGGEGSDTILAGAGNNSIFSGSGDDQVLAGDGVDVISLGDGNDYALAGGGDDTVDAGVGADTVTAGGGEDKINGGHGDDRLSGGGGRDELRGDRGSDRLFGGDANDRLFGADGDDRLYGNAGNDAVAGDAGVDRLFGGSGDDRLNGGSSNDKIYGEAGNDTLLGHNGRDILSGGIGNDRFFNNDAFVDYVLGEEGSDTAELSAGDVLTSIELFA